MVFAGRRGFSLVEVLIVLAVSAVAASVLGGILWAGIRVDRRVRCWERSERGMIWFLDALQRDLDALVPWNTAAGGVLGFHGGPRELSFLAVEGDGLALVRYVLTSPDGVSSRGDRGRVLRDVRPIGTGNEGRGRRVEVLGEVARDGLRFAYASGMDRDGGVTWSPSWEGPGPPAAVRVTLTGRACGSRDPGPLVRRLDVPLGLFGRRVFTAGKGGVRMEGRP